MLGDLTDVHILVISKRIVDKIKLKELGLILELTPNEIEFPLRKHEANITEASYDILQKWLLRQPNRQEALKTMKEALIEAKLNLIATEVLMEDRAGPDVVSHTRGI